MQLRYFVPLTYIHKYTGGSLGWRGRGGVLTSVT